MNEITTVGLDLAKHVFQVHAVDAEGATVLRKQLRRAQLLAFFSRLSRWHQRQAAPRRARWLTRPMCFSMERSAPLVASWSSCSATLRTLAAIISDTSRDYDPQRSVVLTMQQVSTIVIASASAGSVST
jgi:hypothetical protein